MSESFAIHGHFARRLSPKYFKKIYRMEEDAFNILSSKLSKNWIKKMSEDYLVKAS